MQVPITTHIPRVALCTHCTEAFILKSMENTLSVEVMGVIQIQLRQP